MKTRICMMAIVTLLLGNAVALAADVIYFHRGGPPKATGEITDMSPTEVGLAGKAPFSAESIRYIRFDGEPKTLSLGRKYALAGRYSKARSTLKTIKAGSIVKPIIRADFAFYEAFCFAKYAFTAPAKKQEKYLALAEKKLTTFVGTPGKMSYHLFEARELLGDIVLATAKLKKDAAAFGKARQHYAAVSRAAPWPARKMRMSVKTAKAFQAEGKNEKAATLFRTISQSKTDGPGVDGYKRQATLGIASAMAAGGQASQAIAMVNKVILATDPKEHDVLASAYLVMGRCARAGGKPKEELMAYLHIDMLYTQDPEIHEEALGRLAKLWVDAGKAKRASDAKLKLRSLYPNSQWLKR